MSDNLVDIPSKKQKRLQNRKRKLEAFFSIALMNDNQREKNRDQQEPSNKRRKTSESAKKRRKKPAKNNHGRDKYKQEIAELLTSTKKTVKESEKKQMLSEEEHKNLKKALHMRKKFLKSQPRFWIREHGLKASLDLPVQNRIPLFVGDVQHLVLFALLGNSIHQEHNRWCHLERHGLVSQVVVVLLDGVGAGDLTRPVDKLSQVESEGQTVGKSVSDLFPFAVELISPETYDRSLADDISLVPLSARMCRKMLLKYGSKEAELKSKVFRAAFPISNALGKRDKPADPSEVPTVVSSKNDSEEKTKKKKKKHESNDEEPEKADSSEVPTVVTEDTSKNGSEEKTKKKTKKHESNDEEPEKADSSEVPTVVTEDTSKNDSEVKTKKKKKKKHESNEQEPEKIETSVDKKKEASNDKQESDKENKEEEKGGSKNKLPQKPLWHPADKFPRLELLLSPSQMVEESFAMPLGEMAYKYQHYAYTKDQYAEVTPFSPMFGLDCEMCFTVKRRNELTRITIVNEAHESVYETLVMPDNKIINYLTQYSGITPQMMRGVTTRLQDVQNDIRKLLPPDAILVGQSLNCDLHALEMFHPYVIDSSVVFNIWGQRKKKTKLKTLVEMFLGEKIQQGHEGHDSCEDASAALKLVQFKLSKSIDFGDCVLGFSTEMAKDHIPNPSDADRIPTRPPTAHLPTGPATNHLPSPKGLTKKQVETLRAEVKNKPEEKDYKYLPTDLPQPEVLKVMEASSLFRLAARTKKVGVFGTHEVVHQYSKYLSNHEMKGTQVALRAGSHGFEARNNFNVVKKFIQDMPMFDLAIAHLKMNILGNEKERVRTINSCLKIAKNVKDNGVMIIVAGGRPRIDKDGNSEHRPACFVHLSVQPFTKL